jgi:TRAP transporter 4TM/12TM fusion protein
MPPRIIKADRGRDMAEEKAVLGAEDSVRMARESETGTRNIGGKVGVFIRWFAIIMSIFQLSTGFFGELGGYKQLSVHLFFAMFLCFVCFPFSSKSRRDHIAVMDWVMAIISSILALYVFLNYEHWVNAQGAAPEYDLIIGGVLLLFILEATRRSVSPVLPLITIVFLLYAYLGPYIPGELAHRGFRVGRIVDHVFMSGEGLWSVPLRVSATFVFLFVLFGAFLDKIGAGEYLINLSFATMGKYRGGPAKAAVVASCAMGSISGSAIANTVTTGAMTIPLMKKVGFKPHTAGAVEVAASTNGQLMPPIMGAAAFIMAEMLGVSYFEVVKAAFIPAVLSYTAIFSIVHIEAIKDNIRGLTDDERPPLVATIISGMHYLVPLFVLIYLLLIIFWTPTTAAAWSILWGAVVAIFNNYYRAKRVYPRLASGEESAFANVPKDFMIITVAFVLIGILLYLNNLGGGMSAGAWNAMIAFIILAPIAAFILIKANDIWYKSHKDKNLDEVADPVFQQYRQQPEGFFKARAWGEITGALEAGAKNMAGIAAACACCGIIIGVVTLTGLGLKMANMITAAAGGLLFLTLLYSVLACIILGMGLPTTATYIMMASMTAPAINLISQEQALGIPIIAIHLFVFYYGIVADDTPPVGLCAYAAAGIAGSDPIKTGWKSFRLDLAAFTLPFMFIYNTKLLMFNTNWLELLYLIPLCIVGMFCWSVFIQGYWLVKTFIWERFIFMGLAFLLVNPGDIDLGGFVLNYHVANFIAIAGVALLYLWHRARKKAQGPRPAMA